MIQESLLYHSMIIKILLGFLLINLFIPLFFAQNSISSIKAVRIGSFFFSALITMVAFTGIILYILDKKPWSIEMSLMVLAFVLLSVVEFVRIKKLKRLWIEEKSIASLSWKYVSMELIIVSATVGMMIMGI